MPEQQPAVDCPESLEAFKAEVVRLRAQVAEQAALIAQLLQRNQELEARLAKESHNSSKPPSSDPPSRSPRRAACASPRVAGPVGRRATRAPPGIAREPRADRRFR